MMRVLFCLTCRRAYQVIGELQEVKSLLEQPEWEKGFPCVTSCCRGLLVRMHKEHKAGVLGLSEMVDVPVKNFYRAIHGFGLGIGEPASIQRIRDLLTKERVIDIVAEPTNSNERVIVRELVLSNGARIHLGASHMGACVYYVEEPQSCVEVFDNEVRAEEAARGSAENREEVGRAPEAGEGERTEAGGAPDHAGANGQPGGVSPVHEAGDVPPGPATGADECDSDDSGVRV